MKKVIIALLMIGLFYACGKEDEQNSDENVSLFQLLLAKKKEINQDSILKLLEGMWRDTGTESGEKITVSKDCFTYSNKTSKNIINSPNFFFVKTDESLQVIDQHGLEEVLALSFKIEKDTMLLGGLKTFKLNEDARNFKEFYNGFRASSTLKKVKSEHEGDWAKVAPIRGTARAGAVSFKIGDYVYIGLGYDQDIWPRLNFIRSKDGISWEDVASFPGAGRVGAVAFVLGKKAYVGTGYKPAMGTSSPVFYKDFYCYDSETNTWSLATEDFGGLERRNAIAFTLNVDGKEIGYIGCGSTNNKEYLNDFWSFDGVSWNPKSSHGRKRNGGTAFVIDNVAYMCLGYESNTQLAPDMLKFDGKIWRELDKILNSTELDFDDDYTTIQRANAVSFVAPNIVGEKRAYIATGINNGSLVKNCWEYNPKTDRWNEVNPLVFQMPERVAAVSFSIKNTGFVTFGGRNLDQGEFNDTWKFIPGIDEKEENNY